MDRAGGGHLRLRIHLTDIEREGRWLHANAEFLGGDGERVAPLRRVEVSAALVDPPPDSPGALRRVGEEWVKGLFGDRPARRELMAALADHRADARGDLRRRPVNLVIECDDVKVLSAPWRALMFRRHNLVLRNEWTVSLAWEAPPQAPAGRTPGPEPVVADPRLPILIAGPEGPDLRRLAEQVPDACLEVTGAGVLDRIRRGEHAIVYIFAETRGAEGAVWLDFADGTPGISLERLALAVEGVTRRVLALLYLDLVGDEPVVEELRDHFGTSCPIIIAPSRPMPVSPHHAGRFFRELIEHRRPPAEALRSAVVATWSDQWHEAVHDSTMVFTHCKSWRLGGRPYGEEADRSSPWRLYLDRGHQRAQVNGSLVALRRNTGVPARRVHAFLWNALPGNETALLGTQLYHSMMDANDLQDIAVVTASLDGFGPDSDPGHWTSRELFPAFDHHRDRAIAAGRAPGQAQTLDERLRRLPSNRPVLLWLDWSAFPRQTERGELAALEDRWVRTWLDWLGRHLAPWLAQRGPTVHAACFLGREHADAAALSRADQWVTQQTLEHAVGVIRVSRLHSPDRIEVGDLLDFFEKHPEHAPPRADWPVVIPAIMKQSADGQYEGVLALLDRAHELTWIDLIAHWREKGVMP